MKFQTPPEIDHLAELIGEFTEYWGFKKIHGKIWLHLHLSERPLDAQDLMKRLNVSKALISISIKDLLEYDVILTPEIGPTGTRGYVTNPDVHAVIARVLRSREKVMLGKIRSAFKDLKDLPSHEISQYQIQPAKIRELDRLVTQGETLYKAITTLL